MACQACINRQKKRIRLLCARPDSKQCLAAKARLAVMERPKKVQANVPYEEDTEGLRPEAIAPSRDAPDDTVQPESIVRSVVGSLAQWVIGRDSPTPDSQHGQPDSSTDPEHRGND